MPPLPPRRSPSRRPTTSRLLLAVAPILALLLLAPSPVPAQAPVTTFELMDGSVVSGEVVDIDGGIYQVRTPTLGTVRIEQADVRVMRRGAVGDAAESGADYGDQLEAMQRQLVGDPEVMGMITALQSDPNLRRALSDPALLQAVTAGDLKALQTNDRFQELLRHPGIRAIIERVEGR